MKVKVAELRYYALDWAVALAEGKRPSIFIFQRTGALSAEHHYSTDWAQGGPIKEREGIVSGPSVRGDFFAFKPLKGADSISNFGPTELVAAMRCYVASKFGDEIDLPEEIL